MIELTRINGTHLYLNPDLVETVEATPDTVITMTNGHRLIVRDSAADIRDAVIDFRAAIAALATLAGAPCPTPGDEATDTTA